MAKSWNRHQAKKFARELKLGQSYYVVLNVAQNIAPYEDSQLYSESVFTGRLPFTGTPCTEYGSAATTWCQNSGPVYDAPPKGLRNIATPGPQVAGPLAGDEHREFNAYEIERAEKQNEANQADQRRKSNWW